MSSMKTRARHLGDLMCDTTLSVLWQPASHWLAERKPGSELRCRTGSGQATYHRFDPQQNRHLITYGARMIEAKQRPDTAHGWLSSREIVKRGYFGGELSPLNLLAHTCCHEFAHLLQHTDGKRFRGSVHNRHFYRILDELHASGGADETREALRSGARSRGLELSDTVFSIPEPSVEPLSWQVGECVSFGKGQEAIQGKITRINRKTCTVDGTGRARGIRYRVPYPMLRRAG
ncbi:hypothetical protein [Marinobacter nitratireducens]|nr:hypothetical protein [Marinobacter nitratireducens]